MHSDSKRRWRDSWIILSNKSYRKKKQVDKDTWDAKIFFLYKYDYNILFNHCFIKILWKYVIKRVFLCIPFLSDLELYHIYKVYDKILNLRFKRL